MAEPKRRKKTEDVVVVRNPETGEKSLHNTDPSFMDTMKEAFMDNAQAARIQVERDRKRRRSPY